MYKVLITTTAFTNGACSTSSMVVTFDEEDDALSAERKALHNTNSIKNITVTAVFLNPSNKKK